MQERSFRDILNRFLEETQDLDAASAAPTKAKPTPEPMPLLTWQAPNLKILGKSTYPKPNPKAQRRPAKTISTPPPENVLVFGQLSAADQSDVQLLIVLGADFREGISLPRLKKAHRRLAKTLHPDRIDKTLTKAQRDLRQEKFLVLQAAYERLSRSLPTYKASETICDNGSASAPDCRRPDAA